MSEIPPELLTYYAARKRQRDEQVAEALEGRTQTELALMREAAVMGYVLGMRTGRDYEATPPDADILYGVVSACLVWPDLYPTISRTPRDAEEATDDRG
jgi:hypothetical protein